MVCVSSLIVIAICQLLGLFLNYCCFFHLSDKWQYSWEYQFYWFLLARVRLLRNEPITSGEILKTIRKFEKVNYKLRKTKIDINFLIYGETSYQTLLRFVWLIKIFKILLSILNLNRISYKWRLTIRTYVWELCKMNLILCVMIYNLAWTLLILLTYLPFFVVAMISF